MSNTAWVILKDGTIILIMSGSRYPAARSDTSGTIKKDSMYQYLSKISGNLNQSIYRMYQYLGKLYGNILTKLRMADII